MAWKELNMALILFVDDDPLTLETMSRAAQVLGHRALVAGSGTQALEVVGGHSIDLIFVDVRLPDIDGYDLVEKIKAEGSTAGIPILILSADPDIESANKAHAAGARDYIPKPIRLHELEALITSYTIR